MDKKRAIIYVSSEFNTVPGLEGVKNFGSATCVFVCVCLPYLPTSNGHSSKREGERGTVDGHSGLWSSPMLRIRVDVV